MKHVQSLTVAFRTIYLEPYCLDNNFLLAPNALIACSLHTQLASQKETSSNSCNTYIALIKTKYTNTMRASLGIYRWLECILPLLPSILEAQFIAALLYRLSRPKKNYNRTFSINIFQNCTSI